MDLLEQDLKHDDAVKHAMRKWYYRCDKKFYIDGMDTLVNRWRKCVKHKGNYVEKIAVCTGGFYLFPLKF